MPASKNNLPALGISRRIQESLEHASAIRTMFEEGLRLKAAHGEANVFDLSLGNPVVEPPEAVRRALKRLVIKPEPGCHRYMPNVGHPEAREAVAARLSRWTGVIFEADDVVLTVGAAGGLSVFFKAILDPGDEVLGVAPYFPEYPFYVESHGGVFKTAESRPDFHLDPDAIGKALGPRTRALILNSPNNPTGRMYDAAEIDAVADRLHARGNGIYLVSDEPYRRLVFWGRRFVEVVGRYPRTVVVGSHSKDLAIPGERIGWVALAPSIPKAQRVALIQAMSFAMRALGFVNAPALMQRLTVATGDAHVPARLYESRLKVILDPLRQAGYEVEAPDGAFYLFPKTPDPDDKAFCRRLLDEEHVVCVPGSGFGRPGHLRIAFCVEPRVLEGALPGLARAARW